LACGTEHGAIVLVDTTDEPHIVRQWTAATASGNTIMPIFALAFHPRLSTLVSAGADDHIRAWDIAGRSTASPVEAHQQYVKGLSFSLDGDQLASAGQDGSVKLWDGASLRALRTTNLSHALQTSTVAFSMAGTLLTSGGLDGTLILWDPATGQAIGSPLDVEPHASEKRHFLVAVRFVGDTLIVASDDGVTQFDVRDDSWARVAKQMAGRSLSQEELHEFAGF
jgi:WD40 repeat protein